METPLGQIPLTRNQMGHLSTLHTPKVRGFTVNDSGVVVTSTGELTDSEINALVSGLSALPDSPPMPPKTQIDSEIDAAVSVPELKSVLKKILNRIS